MDIPKYSNNDPAPSSQPSPFALRFAIPLSVLFLLLAMNGFFWYDYAVRKNRIAFIQKDIKTMLSATAEEQKAGLEESKTVLGTFEKESSMLLAELASTSNQLLTANAELSGHEQEMALFASSTALEMEKHTALDREINGIKNTMLPL
jgi:hypothetical protein